MNKKELILRSILIFIGLWIITTIFTNFMNAQMADYLYYGFPFKYSEGGGLSPDGASTMSFSRINLTIDIILHLATAIIMALFSFKIRNKIIAYSIIATTLILFTIFLVMSLVLIRNFGGW